MVAPKSTEKKASKKKVAKKTAAKKATTEATGAGLAIKGESYEATKSASGKRSFDSGDPIAVALRGKTLDEVYDTADEVASRCDGDATAKELRAKYAHLNVGMQRMSVGNKIRKWLKAAGKTLSERGKIVTDK